jgi:hypothetical protein
MNKVSHSLIASLLFITLATLASCNRSPFTVAPVHGKITVDDKPLFQGKVMFAPIAQADQEKPGKPAFGTIQSNGDYRLTTFAADDGAVVGEHWVTIINIDEDLPDGVPEFDRITSPEKVKIVAAHDNEIDIKLTNDVVKKYASDNR